MDSQKSNSGNLEDEAQEKLFTDTNTSSEPKIEIKFLDSKNGDTKIDIYEVRQVFVGMGKEELLKFANDPFWVRMRLCLFILFWVLWVGMLAGAVAIILLAPKCDSGAAKYNKGNTIYKVKLDHFGDAAIDNLESSLDYFKDLGVDTLLLDSVMETAPGTDDIVNFKSVNPKYGTLDSFQRFIQASKTKGLKILMSLIPNFSSIKHEWFEKSVEREDPYTDYYVWSDPTYADEKPKALNNWISVEGNSSWEWNEKRKQFYLHQFSVNQPDLNFRNEYVVNYFKDVFKFWLNLGVSGLHLDKVEFLIEDINFLNESIAGTVGTIHTDYNFLSHTKTTYQPDTLEVLSEWANVFKNYSAILSLSGIQDGVNFEKADLISRPIRVTKTLTAGDLQEALRHRINKASQTWDITCDSKEDCNEKAIFNIQAVLLMLPGTTVFHGGLECGLPIGALFQWQDSEIPESESKDQGLHKRCSLMVPAKEDPNTPDNPFNMFRKLLQERLKISALSGAPNITVLDSSVLVVTRSNMDSSDPDYLVALNLEASDKDVNLQEALKVVPSKISMVTASSDFSNLNNDLWYKTSSLKIPGMSFIVFTYEEKE